jgi:signal transduction histidine kinase
VPYSNFPFPVRDSRKLDSFKQVSLAVLLANPEEGFARFETRNGVETIRYARAMVMRQDCVDCHSRPELGFQGKWKVGDVRGARQVSLPVSNVEPIHDAATIAAMLIAVFAAITGWFVVQPVVGRLRRSLSESETLAVEKRELAAALDLKKAALQSAILANKRLSAGVSHDPRTPPPVSVGDSYLSKSSSMKPVSQREQESGATDIPDSSLHLSSSIGELLEVSPGEEDAWQPDEKLIDLLELVNSIRPVLQASLADVSMTLSILDSPDPAVLYGDEGAVRRLLTTIVDNAAKHGGGTNVEISMITRTSGEVVIRIADDGAGIDPDKLREPLQFGARPPAHADTNEKSLGIGLWLVDSLMTVHGGQVTFNEFGSDPGFRVALHFPPQPTIEDVSTGPLEG